MTFLSHHTLSFTTLTPVHIGADESYEPGNYVIDDGENALYSFDTQAVISGLEDMERKQLLSLVNGKPNDKMLTDVQAFFHKHREKLIGFARPPILTAGGVAELYQKRIGKTAQQEIRGKRVINKLEIERTAYNPVTNQPILPGSSIKGAIRTALLDQENNNGRTAYKGEKNQKMQERLFAGKFATDPMRLISIGDAVWQGDEQLPDRQIVFAVNRKREQVLKDGKPVLSQAERSNLYQLLESLLVSEVVNFKGSVQIQQLGGLRQDDRKMPKPDKQWQIKDIALACNRFYFPLLQQEKQQMKIRNFLQHNWFEKLEAQLEQGLFKRMDQGDAFLLRVGRHSGAEALTLNGVRRIKIKGNGRDFTIENKPKTWWLASNREKQTTDMLPFGWLLVEIDQPEKTQTTVPNPKLKDWYQKQLDKQNNLKQQADQRQASVQKKLKEQDQLQKQKQEKLLAEQQRLASLSPFDKDLEEFLHNIQAQEHDTRLLKELENGYWEGEEAKQIAEKIKQLMEQQNKWMPDFQGTNKQKVKLKNRSLTVLKFLDDES